MATLTLVIAVLALLLALAAISRAGGMKANLREAEALARRALAKAEDAESQAGRAEIFLTKMARGEHVDAAMIEEGRIFDEIDSEAARKLLTSAAAGGLRVVDVRTREEVEGGHIEGALWIPVDELERRALEVPRDGKVLVFCAVGGRSAAACDYLASRGWRNLTNVVGGMSGYKGATVRGVPAKT
jgi:rhodanese-related sulfurtransferase